MMLELVFLALLSCDVLADPEWNVLYEKYSRDPNDGYYPLPLHEREAMALGWKEPPEESSKNKRTTLLCSDPALCLMYDVKGFIGGVSVGFLTKDVDGCDAYSYNQSVYTKTTRYGIPVYTVTVFIADPDIVMTKGRKNLAGGVETGLWIKNGDGIIEIPTTDSGVRSKTAYTNESCIPGMGDHFYYNISREMDCKNFYPLFLLFKKSKMMGFGIQGFGNHTVFDGSRDWYEAVSVEGTKMTLPNAGQCLYDLVDKCKVVSMHFYWVPLARYVQCPTNKTI